MGMHKGPLTGPGRCLSSVENDCLIDCELLVGDFFKPCQWGCLSVVDVLELNSGIAIVNWRT